jgi:DNA topoisomerase-3
VNRTTVTISDGENSFTVKGDVPLTEGFRRYEPQKAVKDTENSQQENTILPSFTKGEIVQIMWNVAEKQTKAPSRYTVDSLNSYLKSPFKSENDMQKNETVDDDSDIYENIKKGMEIGTVATRTAIITNAVKNYKYIALKGGKYYCTEKGAAFIGYLKELKIDLFRDKNVEFNVMIKNVERGKLTMQQAIDKTSEELRNIVDSGIEVQKADNFSSASEIGKCPFCGKELADGKLNYYCVGYKSGCGFKIWKKTNCKFSFQKSGETINYIKQISLTKQNVKSLLSNGQITVSVEEKSGKGKYKITAEFKPDGRNDFVSVGRVAEKK